MGSRVPTMLVAATTVLAIASAFSVHPAAAQGTSSLAGVVCEAAQYHYIQAPERGGDGKACGAGLEGATVTVKPTGTLGSLPATSKTATADKEGRYELANLADGEYTVEVARAGFDTLTGSAKVAGATARDWMLEGKLVTLSGNVRGPDGEPVRSALVAACCTDKATEARTDAAGKYEFQVKAGHRDVWARDAPGYAEAYRSLLVDGKAAADFTLEKLPPQDAAVTGTVRGADGKPLAGIRVDVHGYGGPSPQPEPRPMEPASDGGVSSSPSYMRGSHNWTTTDSAGRYRVGAYGGQEASVEVSQEGYVPYQQTLTLPRGEALAHDIVLKAYPAKDAKLAGKVVDAKTGEPVRNLSITTQNRPYGQTDWSCDGAEAKDVAGGGSAGSSGSAGTADAMVMPYYPRECAIQVGDDGSFAATLMPGATSVSVSHQSWKECPDGLCEVSYYTWVGMVVLEPRSQSELTVRLVPRPEPDATVQGYVLDSESGKGIANATLWFSSQDAYGYGLATTDADGSYRIQLRQGYHSFGANAPGHHAWEGVVMAGSGTTDLDLRVQAGEDATGWCCGHPMPLAESGFDRSSAGGAAPATSVASTGSSAPDNSQQGVAYKDLGGKLGPYDAQKRSQVQTGGVPAAESQESPAIAGVLLAALLLGLAARRRVQG